VACKLDLSQEAQEHSTRYPPVKAGP